MVVFCWLIRVDVLFNNTIKLKIQNNVIFFQVSFYFVGRKVPPLWAIGPTPVKPLDRDKHGL